MSYAPLDDVSGMSKNASIIVHHENDDEDDARTLSLSSNGINNSSTNRQALSEPLTNGSHGHIFPDPFYVFREDLYRQLESVDDSLAEYLRVVYQTVGGFFFGFQLLLLISFLKNSSSGFRRKFIGAQRRKETVEEAR